MSGRVTPTVPIYHRETSACAGNELRDGRCTSCRSPAMTVYEYDRSRRIQIEEQFELTPEIDPPWQQYHAMYTPAVKPIVPVWKQRQILRQQRPRDGLK